MQDHFFMKYVSNKKSRKKMVKMRVLILFLPDPKMKAKEKKAQCREKMLEEPHPDNSEYNETYFKRGIESTRIVKNPIQIFLLKTKDRGLLQPLRQK